VTAVELAALADDVRRDVPALDGMLADEHVRHDNKLLLELSEAYVHRVSRAAWGIALLVPILMTLMALTLQAYSPAWLPDPAEGSRFLIGLSTHDWLDSLNAPQHWILQICVAAIVAAVARRRAAMRFARLTRGSEPIAIARAEIARLDSWAVAVWTIGVVACFAFCSTVTAYRATGLLTLPVSVKVNVTTEATWQQTVRALGVAARIRDIGIAIALATIASAWIARRRAVWLQTRRVPVIGMTIALITLASERWMPYVLGENGAVAYASWQASMVIIGALAMCVSIGSLALGWPRPRGSR
jgi:hypothetical protein